MPEVTQLIRSLCLVGMQTLGDQFDAIHHLKHLILPRSASHLPICSLALPVLTVNQQSGAPMERLSEASGV